MKTIILLALSILTVLLATSCGKRGPEKDPKIKPSSIASKQEAKLWQIPVGETVYHFQAIARGNNEDCGCSIEVTPISGIWTDVLEASYGEQFYCPNAGDTMDVIARFDTWTMGTWEYTARPKGLKDVQQPS
jgi:hypothetical protein